VVAIAALPTPDQQILLDLAQMMMRIDAKLDRVLRGLGEDDDGEGQDA
jgi:hypothetical protein